MSGTADRFLWTSEQYRPQRALWEEVAVAIHIAGPYESVHTWATVKELQGGGKRNMIVFVVVL